MAVSALVLVFGVRDGDENSAVLDRGSVAALDLACEGEGEGVNANREVGDWNWNCGDGCVGFDVLRGESGEGRAGVQG